MNSWGRGSDCCTKRETLRHCRRTAKQHKGAIRQWWYLHARARDSQFPCRRDGKLVNEFMREMGSDCCAKMETPRHCRRPAKQHKSITRNSARAVRIKFPTARPRDVDYKIYPNRSAKERGTPIAAAGLVTPRRCAHASDFKFRADVESRSYFTKIRPPYRFPNRTAGGVLCQLFERNPDFAVIRFRVLVIDGRIHFNVVHS